MEIHEHAIDQYIQRVLEVNLKVVSQRERESYREVLMEAAINPDLVYDDRKNYIIGEDRMYPAIHIRNEVAIPVDKRNQCVPTAYKAETFLSKIDAEQPA